MNTGGDSVLDDDNLCGWFLDPGITADPARAGRLLNLEPLLVDYVDTWCLRPEAVTAIPNRPTLRPGGVGVEGSHRPR